MEIKPYILCGGSGVRLWPLSRKDYPKQWLKIFADECLFDKALDFAQNDSYGKISIIANAEHRFLIAESIRRKGIEKCDIILEPQGRNTAAAFAIACLDAEKDDSEKLILMLASDHLITKPEVLHNAIKEAAKAVVKGQIAVFGITPTEPNTGYGYIKLQKNNDAIRKVMSFTEKPDKELAQQYIAKGNYFWNASLFLFRPKDMLRALKTHAFDILKAAQLAYDKSENDSDFIRLDEQYYQKIRSQSIDYAVMEKIDNIVCATCEPQWSDMGDWQTVWQKAIKDENRNAVIGDAVLYDTTDCLVCNNGIFTAACGVSNLGIITTADAVLVVDKSKTQQVKKIVELIELANADLVKQHKRCYRPWGWYESILMQKGFQVKRLMVKPGAKLSLQSHKHRLEHWVVVKGVADVTLGDKDFQLFMKEHVVLPALTLHRLGNSGDCELHIIEVQLGDYLGEDDIIRYDDIYNRVCRDIKADRE